MQRMALNVAAALLAAGIIGTSLTVLFWDDDEPLAIDTPLSPSPTPALRSPMATVTTAPSPTPTPSPSPAPTAAPSPRARPAPQAQSQPARSVDCDRTPTFCSSTTGTMEVRDDKLVTSGTTQHPTDYSDVPNTTMTWRIVREGGGDARNGDDVSTLQVVAEIRNDTDRTYVVPRREIVLVVMLDGEVLHELGTSGDDFEMRPGAALTARYDVPLAFDGEYSWRAKTSFHQR